MDGAGKRRANASSNIAGLVAGTDGSSRKRRLDFKEASDAAGLNTSVGREEAAAQPPKGVPRKRRVYQEETTETAALEEENWAPEEQAASEAGRRKRASVHRHVTEYEWTAKWPVYGLAWAQGAASDGSTRPLRLAVSSFLEDRCSNKVAIVDFDPQRGELAQRAEIMHGYAATKLLWRPEDLAGDAADLLATSGDYLRLWRVPSDGAHVRPQAVLVDPLETDWRTRGAVTSFDWNAKETHLIATAHFNGTMNLWDINANQVVDQVQVHASRVYDIAYAQKSGGRFLATASADGSVRLWDERNAFAKAQTLLEQEEGGAGYFRVAWHSDDEYLLAILPMGSPIPVLVDTRRPLAVIATLEGHTAAVNTLAWSPYPNTANQILTAGDDCLVHLYNVRTTAERVQRTAPLRAMRAKEPVNNLVWNAQEPYAAINYHCSVLVFPL